jgi:threonine aldolase
MAERVIDLRSDTVTKPSPAMRAFIAAAEVGDDMSGEDPTVNKLQETVAAYFGMESSLFVPSGTMSNQIAVRAHTQPGDELICEATSHVYVWEAGGPAALSGVMCRTIEGEYGIFDVPQIEGKIRPNDQHYARTRLICLENTHNRGGGRIFPLEKIKAISQWARANGLAMHLDGARIWNAIVASGIPAKEWAKHFDSISVCFSKGLGAPIGSCLVGSKDLIARAHRNRKLFGGAMRQVGIAAAGALFAFENNIDRLAEDHRNAQVIAQAVADVPGCRLDPPDVQTNLVWMEIDPEFGTAKDVQDLMRRHGVLLNSTAAQVCRACTHLDVSAADAERAAEAIRKALRRPAMV